MNLLNTEVLKINYSIMPHAKYLIENKAVASFVDFIAVYETDWGKIRDQKHLDRVFESFRREYDNK